MGDYCGICLELVTKENDRKSVTFECGHLFHLDCYYQWLKARNHPLIANFNVDDRIAEVEKVDLGLSSDSTRILERATSLYLRLTDRIFALFDAGELDVKTGETNNGGGSSRGGSGDGEVAAKDVAAREEVEGAVMADTTETATMAEEITTTKGGHKSSGNDGCDCGCEN